ncbi:MAG: SpoIIE family protein phosphatase [Candidatus Eisenbacteria bacterium]|nr:SpoIIE family protein phosphatase [Candidatus Latescibacterota bacterium]MBD3301384.1 SpoIIE family protein phosphatase [Candidatus Eisenbacteria bacterium]
MKIDWATATDVGKVRRQNEDAVLAEEALGLGILCDGMGGHRAGDVASRLAVRVFADEIRDPSPREDCLQAQAAPESVQALIAAARRANEAVYLQAERNEDQRGMGCTLVALRLRDDDAAFVSIGDSRIYLYRSGRLHRISQDHTQIHMLRQMGIQLDPAEAQQIQGMLVRALGTEPKIDVDFGYGAAFEGDVWLLCSDGLTDELKDAEIEEILRASADADAAAKTCVHRANEAGGHDNVTVSIARIVAGREPREKAEIPRPETCSEIDDQDSDPDGEGLLDRFTRRTR